MTSKDLIEHRLEKVASKCREVVADPNIQHVLTVIQSNEDTTIQILIEATGLSKDVLQDCLRQLLQTPLINQYVRLEDTTRRFYKLTDFGVKFLDDYHEGHARR